MIGNKFIQVKKTTRSANALKWCGDCGEGTQQGLCRKGKPDCKFAAVVSTPVVVPVGCVSYEFDPMTPPELMNYNELVAATAYFLTVAERKKKETNHNRHPGVSKFVQSLR
jgi:hypothetical protein